VKVPARVFGPRAWNRIRAERIAVVRGLPVNVTAQPKKTAQVLTKPGEAPTLQVPHRERGIGKVISAADSADLIAGVKVICGQVWADDRGYFLEIARLGKGAVAEFPAATTQISSALSYPGTIKAFHYHLHQTDYWAAAQGMLQVVLVDLRKDSETFGRCNTLYIGTLRPWQLLVPPGVAHGYKVLGTEPALLVYVTNRHFNPEDEGRIPYNNEDIGYDWETQHK
jgi:dTDP-4-dehydrorhamnose 3,5-epimerase